MEIIENFLPTWYFEVLKENVIKNEDVKWVFISENIAGVDEGYETNLPKATSNIGFSHVFFTYVPPFTKLTTEIYPIFEPLLAKVETSYDVKINQLHRIRAVITPPAKKEGIHLPHTDETSPHYTFLYYLNDSDGDTIFYNQHYPTEDKKLTVEKRISPKANTGVLFNGLHLHSSSVPVNSEYRATLNINFD